MFRNQFDSNMWNPNGYLPLVDYAKEAAKLGPATVGLKNRDTAVLVALCKKSSELSPSHRQIIPIDYHLGISIAGITADARVVSNYLSSECMDYKLSYDSPYPVKSLMTSLGNKMQTATQRPDRSPYGVNLLVAGYDENGPHIYEVTPYATFFNCKANAIGLCSEIARSYLDRNLNCFLDCSTDEIIYHGIKAILGTLPTDEQESSDSLSQNSIAVAIVGKNQNPIKILSEEENAKYLEQAKAWGALADQRSPGGNDESDNSDPFMWYPPDAGPTESLFVVTNDESDDSDPFMWYPPDAGPTESLFVVTNDESDNSDPFMWYPPDAGPTESLFAVTNDESDDSDPFMWYPPDAGPTDPSFAADTEER